MMLLDVRRFAFQASQKISVKLSIVPEDLLDYLLPYKKAHGYTVSVSLSW